MARRNSSSPVPDRLSDPEIAALAHRLGWPEQAFREFLNSAEAAPRSPEPSTRVPTASNLVGRRTLLEILSNIEHLDEDLADAYISTLAIDLGWPEENLRLFLKETGFNTNPRLISALSRRKDFGLDDEVIQPLRRYTPRDSSIPLATVAGTATNLQRIVLSKNTKLSPQIENRIKELAELLKRNRVWVLQKAIDAFRSSVSKRPIDLELGDTDIANGGTELLINLGRDISYFLLGTETETRTRLTKATEIRILVRQSTVLISALQEVAEYDPLRHHNRPRPALWTDVPDYKTDVRALIAELQKLNSLLEAKKPTAEQTIHFAKHFDKFLESFSSSMGKGAAGLLIAAGGALLYQLPIGKEFVDSIWNHVGK